MFHYKAKVTKVYDGDTITVDIDLGFSIWQKGQTIRLYGIDTPEMRGSERKNGLVSRDFVRERILGKEIILHTHKDKKGKYGRYLAKVLYLDNKGNQVDLIKELIDNNLGVAYFGGKKK